MPRARRQVAESEPPLKGLPFLGPGLGRDRLLGARASQPSSVLAGVA